MEFGLTINGTPQYPFQRLDSGYTAPTVSLDAIRKREHKAIREATELAARSDEMGYDYIFTSEQHFGLWGGNTPHPIQAQTAMVGATETVRLVQLANILPWHNPVRAAEQAAYLDVLSNGRAEVGIGKGFGDRETAVFGQHWGADNSSQNKEHVFREAFEVLTEAWTTEGTSVRGEFHSLPSRYTNYQDAIELGYLTSSTTEADPRTLYSKSREGVVSNSAPVMPKPEQEPHPQLWRPITNKDAATWAAARGVNGCFICSNFAQAKALVDVYHETAKQTDWPDHRPEYHGAALDRGWDTESRRGIIPRITVFNTEVADADTIDRWKEGYRFTLSLQQAGSTPHPGKPIQIDVEAELTKNDVPIVGDTETIIDELARLTSTCGYENLNLNLHIENFGLSHEEELTQITSLASHVLPEVAETGV